MTEVRTHILNLEAGDRFRFAPVGPIFRRVQGPDDRIWIQDDAGRQPIHRLDYESCFIFAIDPFTTYSKGNDDEN